MHSIRTNGNSPHMYAWETSESAWCCKCSVVPLWFGGMASVAWDEFTHRCSDLTAKLVVPRSAPGSASTRDAAPRSTSKPQIASGEGVACIQQPATAPDLALGQHLYALAASQPALSRQTRELANRFTHVRLPTSPLLPQTHEYDHDLSSRLDQMLTVRSSEFAACFTIF